MISSDRHSTKDFPKKKKKKRLDPKKKRKKKNSGVHWKCKPNQTDLEMICFDFLKINSKLFKINRHKPAANEVISTLTDSLVKSVEELTSWTKQLHAFLSDQVVKVSHPKKFAKKN